MKNLGKKIFEAKQHIIAAMTLSLAIFVAYMVGGRMGLGGVSIQPTLLALGLLFAEVGRSLTCFGTRYKDAKLEYSGLFVQGLSWWVGSLNLQFLAEQEGLSALLHLAAPLFLLSAFPMVAHYATKHLMEYIRLKAIEAQTQSGAMPETGADPQGL